MKNSSWLQPFRSFAAFSAFSHLTLQSTMLKRPARLQVDPETITDDDKPPQTGTVFNIWYLKWSGGDNTRNLIKLKFRVNIKNDTGYTKAGTNSPICLFFARGCCYQGRKCNYAHRIPTDLDYYPPTQDCFGRDKTADYKDDMTGVGSFNKINRTLYVAGIHTTKNVELVLTRHFEEFGAIEKINVLHGKACAFITYKLESAAQFAKEAMLNQSLDHEEILNVRWARPDPNPDAQKKEKRRLEELAVNTVQNLLKETTHKRQKPSEPEIIEPEEPEEPTNEPEPQQRLLESKPSSFFGSSIIVPTKKSTNLLSGYSSDDDD